MSDDLCPSIEVEAFRVFHCAIFQTLPDYLILDTILYYYTILYVSYYFSHIALEKKDIFLLLKLFSNRVIYLDCIFAIVADVSLKIN